MYLVISLLVLAGYGIWLYQFLIIAYLFTFHGSAAMWPFMRFLKVLYQILYMAYWKKKKQQQQKKKVDFIEMKPGHKY